MTTLITYFAIAAGLGCLIAAAYAIPMRRTWRKEHDLPLATPGPELEPHELESRELTRV